MDRVINSHAPLSVVVFAARPIQQDILGVHHQAEQRGHQDQGEDGRDDQAAQHDAAQAAVEFAAGPGKEHQRQQAQARWSRWS